MFKLTNGAPNAFNPPPGGVIKIAHLVFGRLLIVPLAGLLVVTA